MFVSVTVAWARGTTPTHRGLSLSPSRERSGPQSFCFPHALLSPKEGDFHEMITVQINKPRSVLALSGRPGRGGRTLASTSQSEREGGDPGRWPSGEMRELGTFQLPWGPHTHAHTYTHTHTSRARVCTVTHTHTQQRPRFQETVTTQRERGLI